MEVITFYNDEKFLRQVSRKVNFKKDNYKKELENLRKFCIENEVFAMASIQLGIPLRMIYVKLTDFSYDKIKDKTYNENKSFINPVILERTGETYYWEACASCLDNMGKVLRPYKIKVRYYDEFQKRHIKTLKGFAATVFSHEYDHLNGILHMDIAEQILIKNQEERKIFRETPGNEFQIIKKEGVYPYEKVYRK